jgi:DNA-binding MarR family transcriptional regulator
MKPAPKRAPRTERRPRPAEGPLALDRVIHERLRLGILSALVGRSPITFTEMKELLQTTDGNLSIHARKLEEAGYVSCEKSFEGRIPRTAWRLTPNGRRALEKYLDHMEAILAAARGKTPAP